MFQKANARRTNAANDRGSGILSRKIDTTQRTEQRMPSAAFGHDFSRISVHAHTPLDDDAAANTRCNYAIDDKPITFFYENEPCTKSCTEAHEAVHSADLVTTGACRRLRSAFLQNSDDFNKLQPFLDKHTAWQKQNKARFECNAYPASVSCAERVLKEGNCSAMTMTDECCGIRRAYATQMKANKEFYCKAAAAAFTPYPF